MDDIKSNALDWTLSDINECLDDIGDENDDFNYLLDQMDARGLDKSDPDVQKLIEILDDANLTWVEALEKAQEYLENLLEV